MGLFNFLAIYVLGGITFIPLVLVAVLLHAHLTFPSRPSSISPTANTSVKDSIRRAGDEDDALKSGGEGLDEKFKSKSREADVAAGYFAVCREYVPGGVNGKPPERTTPAGAVVAAESPSVYQSMYRSIFDRNKGPTIDPGKNIKRARNVFFVVLRHGHLMLYDDSEQLEVRHVISLAHHSVTVYAGGEDIPEGELWIRRNAICLARKQDSMSTDTEEATSKPFYLFSENCSDKEDFYFALLQNQERKAGSSVNPPTPMQYEIRDIISLVQRLHSSEEHLQTRWINGLVGRLFLAIYKTHDLENLIRAKITKKIARVKKPAFLKGIVIQKIDMGGGAPYITNPRLKDLTVDGECAAEMDLKYAGNFRIEVAATARIELGTRFKAREVDLVLAVVLKRLEGHLIVRFKPSPSNRLWFSFETMPKIEMAVEPIVSSRQITYNIILRAIESRIREVIAETLVIPHWDDMPFSDTTNQRYRGGIWADDQSPRETMVMKDDEVAEEDVDRHDDTADVDHEVAEKGHISRSSTEIVGSPSSPFSSANSSQQAIGSNPPRQSSDQKTPRPVSGSKARSETPKFGRVGSFTTSGTPVVSMDKTNVDAVKRNSARDGQDAASAMIAIARRSQPTSPAESPVGSPSRAATLPQYGGSYSSTSSGDGHESKPSQNQRMPRKVLTAPVNRNVVKSEPRALVGFGNEPHPPSPHRSHFRETFTSSEKRIPIPSLSAATTAAKKWGWNVLARTNESGSDERGGQPTREGTPEHPIGRGRPLPPPGTPLPHPDRTKVRSAAILVPKRKSMLEAFQSQESRPVPSIVKLEDDRPQEQDWTTNNDRSASRGNIISNPASDGADDLIGTMDMDDDDDLTDVFNAYDVPNIQAKPPSTDLSQMERSTNRVRRSGVGSVGREADLFPSTSSELRERRRSVSVVEMEKKQA